MLPMPRRTPNRRPGSSLRTLLVLTLSTLPLAGCQTLTPAISTRYVDTSCEAFKAISYSRLHDTPETIAEIRGHNAAFDAICSKP